MIDALVSGRLYGQPTERTSKNGNPYVTAKVRVPTADGDAQFVNVIAFAPQPVAALLALSDGDSAALSGELTVGTYQARDGTVRPSVSLTAHAALTAYHVQRKRQAVTDQEAA